MAGTEVGFNKYLTDNNIKLDKKFTVGTTLKKALNQVNGDEFFSIGLKIYQKRKKSEVKLYPPKVPRPPSNGQKSDVPTSRRGMRRSSRINQPQNQPQNIEMVPRGGSKETNTVISPPFQAANPKGSIHLIEESLDTFDCQKAENPRILMILVFFEGDVWSIRVFTQQENDEILPTELNNRRIWSKWISGRCVEEIKNLGNYTKYIRTDDKQPPRGKMYTGDTWKWKNKNLIVKLKNAKYKHYAKNRYDIDDLLSMSIRKLDTLRDGLIMNPRGTASMRTSSGPSTASTLNTASLLMPAQFLSAENTISGFVFKDSKNVNKDMAFATLIECTHAICTVVEHETGHFRSSAKQTSYEDNKIDKILWSRCFCCAKKFDSKSSLKPMLHIWYICMACIIAAAGLATNSAPVVVAAMLVSSMMEPIKGMSTALRGGGCSARFFGHAWILLVDLGICVLIGYFAGHVASSKTEIEQTIGNVTFDASYTRLERLSGYDTWKGQTCIDKNLIKNGVCSKKLGDDPIDNLIKLPGEISGRGIELGLVVAIVVAGASAAALVTADKADNKSALVGIGISASLLPPAVNAGILWALHAENFISSAALERDLGRKGGLSFSLTLVNIVIILFIWTVGFKCRNKLIKTYAENIKTDVNDNTNGNSSRRVINTSTVFPGDTNEKSEENTPLLKF